MENNLSKTELLETLQVERGHWQALLAQVGEQHMTEQLLKSWWSIKDVIAHIAWHERETAEVLQPGTRLLPAREWLWDQHQDKRNAILFAEFRDRPLADVLAEEQQAYQQLLVAVQATAEVKQRNPGEFPGMDPTWQPWQLVAMHSYEHYRQHTPAIRAWLDTTGPQHADQQEALVGFSS